MQTLRRHRDQTELPNVAYNEAENETHPVIPPHSGANPAEPGHKQRRGASVVAARTRASRGGLLPTHYGDPRR